jgi:hypothetical protein
MLQKQIDEFITLSADLLPELFEKSKVGDSELYDDYAFIHFTLEKGISVAEIMDCLEDQMDMVILYHHVPTNALVNGNESSSKQTILKVTMSTGEIIFHPKAIDTYIDTIIHLYPDLISEMDITLRNAPLVTHERINDR